MLNHILIGLFAFSIMGQAAETSLFFPAAKKLPKGYALDPTWKRNCPELDLTDEFDLDNDGYIDTMYIKKFPAKHGKIKSWRNIAWAQMAFKLSTSKMFVEIPSLLDYLDHTSGGVTNCGKGPGVTLIPDSCTKAGRFRLLHGTPLGDGYLEDKHLYYPNPKWMDSFSIANRTADWVNEGATNGKLSPVLRMIKFEWSRKYSFDVEKNGIRIYNLHDHIDGCAESSQTER